MLYNSCICIVYATRSRNKVSVLTLVILLPNSIFYVRVLIKLWTQLCIGFSGIHTTWYTEDHSIVSRETVDLCRCFI